MVRHKFVVQEVTLSSIGYEVRIECLARSLAACILPLARFFSRLQLLATLTAHLKRWGPALVPDVREVLREKGQSADREVEIGERRPSRRVRRPGKATTGNKTT
jgi:hypothetical protein